MKKSAFLLLGFMLCLTLQKSMGQDWSSPEVEQMFQQGMNALSRGNATEAVAILQKVMPLEPASILVRRSLAQAYLLSGNHKNTLVALEPLFQQKTADAESYRIAAQAYAGMNDDKKAQKTLSEGLSLHPGSGLLYYESGLLFKKQKNYEQALKNWLDGIARDPEFRLNYHEAAIAYVQTDHPVWAILYAEIFVNKEPNTPRGSEMRILLLDAYQKLFFTPSKNVGGDPLLVREPANFEEAVKKTYLGLFFVVSDGISTENLIMLRSRFIINWMNTYADRYPYSLFAYHDDMMRNGYFDSYNQWLVGKAENPQHFSSWTGSFPDEMANLDRYRAQSPLRMSTADNYNALRNFKGLFPEHLGKSPKR